MKNAIVHLSRDFDKANQAVIPLCRDEPILKESGEMWTCFLPHCTCEACKKLVGSPKEQQPQQQSPAPSK